MNFESDSLLFTSKVREIGVDLRIKTLIKMKCHELFFVKSSFKSNNQNKPAKIQNFHKSAKNQILRYISTTQSSSSFNKFKFPEKFRHFQKLYSHKINYSSAQHGSNFRLQLVQHYSTDPASLVPYKHKEEGFSSRTAETAQ